MSGYYLSEGKHHSLEDGTCALELVSHLANEPFSDSPECTSPVLAAYVRALNDRMLDGPRNELLLPLVSRLLNTRDLDGTKLAHMCAERAVRVFAPIALRATELPELIKHAEILEHVVMGDAAYRANAAATASYGHWDAVYAVRAAAEAAYAASAIAGAGVAARAAANANRSSRAALAGAREDAAECAVYAARAAALSAGGDWAPAITLLEDMLAI